jgi:hypothetical protein
MIDLEPMEGALLDENILFVQHSMAEMLVRTKMASHWDIQEDL